jgi:transcription elongation factor Elf1
MNKLFKKLFCRHKKVVDTVVEADYSIISGEEKVIRCIKCGKVFERWFERYAD